jgi:hypothetical protein
MSPRESRLLRFLELSGVGRAVENEEEEEERRAARLDSWIVCVGVGGEGRGGFWLNLQLLILHSFLVSHHYTSAVEDFHLYFLSVLWCESTIYLYLFIRHDGMFGKQ